jgi:hypothetical protein
MGKDLVAPLGAWRYFQGSVPVPLYHGFELLFLGRYYQLSRDPAAAEQIAKTKDYYPYVFTPQNTVEYSSAVWWKQGWDPAGGAMHGAEFAAWLCGDGRNRLFADRRARIYQPYYWTVFCGEAWDEGLAKQPVPEPMPNRFIVEDRSIVGFRGRFGLFSFVGGRGKAIMSFGGCMVDAVGDYGGYLQVARLGITVPGAADKPYFEALRAVAVPDEPVAGSQQIGQDFAALTARFIPRMQLAPDAPYDDWQTTEEWLFTPQGVVAMFEAKALKDRPSGCPEGLVRLGPIERPHRLQGEKFSVGPLYGRILDSESFDASMAEGASDQSAQGAKVEIRFKLEKPPATILRGQVWRYAIAFFPEENVSASRRMQHDGSQLVTIAGLQYHFQTDSAGAVHVERLK